MKRQLTALAMAMSLGLASLPGTPAEARHNDSNVIVPLVLGAAALAILMNQHNGARPDDHGAQPFYGNGGGRYDDRDRRRIIPAQCVMQMRVGDRLSDVVVGRCADQAGFGRRLPADCAFDVRTRYGRRSVYGSQCLRDYGYRIDRGRY